MRLLDFDTVIFDLDDTIWSGSEPDLWAKKLTPPLIPGGNRVYDHIGKYLELHDGVKETLEKLNAFGRCVGFSTVGGWKETPYDWQPAVVVLRCFGILHLFNYSKVIQYRDGNKTKDFLPCNKTLFIDDNQKHLDEVKQAFPNVEVLHRHHFKTWSDLL